MDKSTRRKVLSKVQWVKLLLVTALAFTSLTPSIANADSAPPKPGLPGISKPPPAPPVQPQVSWNT